MALYMFFYVAPDDHLEFLRVNPSLFDAYLGGEAPDLKQGLISRLLGKEPPETPDDWPSQELHSFSPEVNHRQVKIFHYLLNGTNDLVDDVGSLFQTWFKPRQKSPAFSIDGENFALSSRDAGKLLKLIEDLTPELLRKRLARATNTSESQDSDEFVKEAFDVIEKACKQAVSAGQGLMWTNR